MSVQQRRLKVVTFSIGATNFECQLSSWKLDPGIKTGDRMYTYCTDTANNSFIEETDGEPNLDMKFFSDWRSGGISDFLWSNNLATAAFQLDHHPDITGEHVRWVGSVQVQAPTTGGDARDTEVTEITLPIIGTLGNGLTYSRIG